MSRRNKPTFTPETEKIFELANQAWILTPDQLDSIQPGAAGIGQLASMLDLPPSADQPLVPKTMFDRDNPHVHLLKVMSDPQFFPFTCHHLFSRPDGGGPLNLLPFQHIALQELWWRQFPMLVFTRGGGKCQKGDTLIMTSNGIARLDALAGHLAPMEKQEHPGVAVFGESGFRNLAYSWANGDSDTIKVRSQHGFEVESTLDHPVRVVRDGQIVWCDTRNLAIGDTLVIDRTPSWFPNDNGLPDDLAYLFGVLVGDGGYTVRGHIGLTSADEHMVEACSAITQKYWGKPFRKQSTKYQYLLCGVAIWDELFQKYGFNSPVCAEKDVPTSILSAPKESCRAFLRGLFDTDGCSESRGPTLCSKSERLVRTVQFLLTRFGIISRVRPKFNTKYQQTYWNLSISGRNARIFAAVIGFGLSRKNQKLRRDVGRRPVNVNNDVIPLGLVESDLDELRDAIIRRPRGSGGNPERYLLSRWRLKQYGLTYERLGVILDGCQSAQDAPCYQRLRDLYLRRPFFDPVVSLEASRAFTYDLYVPDDHSFVSNGIISHNSFLLGLYALLRATFTPGSKIVITAAAFRQAKAVFEYIERIWHGSPVFRSLVNSGGGDRGRKNGPRRDIDRVEFVVGDSTIIGLPLGTGERIRGLRANYILSDEIASIPEDIYATVVQGFASVTADPVGNVRDQSRIVTLKRLGLWTEDMDADERKKVRGNQSVLSGTAYYSFNHFYKYWVEYKSIIETGGNPALLEEVLKGPPPDGFRWDAYSVMRLPYSIIPHGYMDASTIARAKQITNTIQFGCEYEAVFATDSDGFFKRSLIEKCVVGNREDPFPPTFGSCGKVEFVARVRGDAERRYIYGIDPASERDQFAVVIIEEWGDHRRIVYCWTTSKSDHRNRLKKKMVKEHDFYRYAVRKIRDLMKTFPCERMLVDAGGGGISLREALGDPDKLEDGETPIYEAIDPDPKNHKDTDNMAGEHVLEMVHFRKTEWVAEANHGMKKDMEDRILLFPLIDPLALGMAEIEDANAGRVTTNDDGETVYATYDTLEDCMLEIESLKDELATIVVSATSSGLEHWDTPDTKTPGQKAGRMRKDRYSALLMANMGARLLARTLVEPEHNGAIGGFSNTLVADNRKNPRDSGGELYQKAPAWFRQGVAGHGARYGMTIRRT